MNHLRIFHTTQPAERPPLHEWQPYRAAKALAETQRRRAERQQRRYENFLRWVEQDAPAIPQLNQSPDAPGYAVI